MAQYTLSIEPVHSTSTHTKNVAYAEKGTLYRYMVLIFCHWVSFQRDRPIEKRNQRIFIRLLFCDVYVRCSSLTLTATRWLGESIGDSLRIDVSASAYVCLGSVFLSFAFSLSIQWHFQLTPVSKQTMIVFERLQLLFQDLYDLHFAFFCYCFVDLPPTPLEARCTPFIALLSWNEDEIEIDR